MLRQNAYRLLVDRGKCIRNFGFGTCLAKHLQHFATEVPGMHLPATHFSLLAG